MQSVWDKDHVARDDRLGDATIDIISFLKAKQESKGGSNNTIVRKIPPKEENCHDKESETKWENGKLIQEMTLKLRNVKSGKIVLQLHQT